MDTSFANVDIQLLKKYDRPGPRYTSYPTAPLFSTSFTADDLAAEIAATNAPGSDADLSLYFHFPFCDTLCYFCGCTMLVTRDRARDRGIPGYLKGDRRSSRRCSLRGAAWSSSTGAGERRRTCRPTQIRGDRRAHPRPSALPRMREASVEIDPRELGRDTSGGPARRRVQPDEHGGAGLRPARSRRRSTGSSPSG